MAPRPLSAAIALCLLLLPSCATPAPGGAGGGAVEVRGALKLTALGSRAPDDPRLYPDRSTGTAFSRFRLEVTGRPREDLAYEFAYEQRALATSHAGAAGGGILPSVAPAPFRIRQLDWPLVEHGGRLSWRHEIDRALVAVHPSWGEVVVGRQAIGLGRGVLFSAVDVFAPFAPTEVDREWRRGVDAARVEYRLTDTTSAELLAVAGETWDDSALLGRIRGYVGDVDAELIFGKRAEDLMWGGVVSAVVGESEVHAELALFDTPEGQPDGGLFGNAHLVPKAVLGASHTFDVGNGLTVVGEYHYSGFGLIDAGDAATRLADPAFRERFLRGDTQILGRHALGLQASHPFTESWTGSLLMLMNPIDGSGLLSPSVVWDVSDSTSLLVTTFVPWGAGPSGGALESEYGASPLSLLLQLSTYF